MESIKLDLEYSKSLTEIKEMLLNQEQIKNQELNKSSNNIDSGRKMKYKKIHNPYPNAFKYI